MIVTYNWLKEFVDCTLAPEELAHRLTMAGLEVDAMEQIGAELDNVIVAGLVSVDPHPDADRLTVCKVDTGSGMVQVVCGAKNHRSGDLVALAQVGSVLPGDFKIKKSKIRGQESQGMLCSERELGLTEESEGILILPQDLPLGVPVFEALGLKDVRFELGLTPNRADCLSIVGVAREVAAMTGSPLHLPQPAVRESGEEIGQLTSVTIEEPELCPRYAARLIRNVSIGPSPEWLVRRLESVGQRSINNVVDVTNYVLMELGHPLHAFDFRLLRGGRIVVKRALDGDCFTTLDSLDRVLGSDDLTICDGEGAVALAGIMGGENSEIQADTVDILLESAYFHPGAIRRTSKRLGIHTESSHRFERGADINMVPVALDRAAALIVEVAGGNVARGRIDNYPKPIAPRLIDLSIQRTNQILGLDLEPSAIVGLLSAIGLEIQPAAAGERAVLSVGLPTFRPDLEREIDLVEEVARLNGYDRIPVTMPESRITCHTPPVHVERLNQARNALIAAGFSEIINYSFVAPGAWDRIRLGDDDPRRRTVPLLNPLNEEQSVMRTSLVPSVLETVARNLAYRSRDLRLFELRPVFLPGPADDLPLERQHLVAAISGRRAPEGWCQVDAAVDFFDLKGATENLLARFRVTGISWDATQSEPFLHPGKSCSIIVGTTSIGTIGEVHPEVLAGYEIDLPLYLVDLDLDAVFSQAGDFPGIRSLSRFPDIFRDSALVLAEEVSAAQLLQAIDRAKSRYAEEVVLFDIYRGSGVPEGEKSVGIRVRYRSAEKTLTDEEIQAAHGRILKVLEKEFGARLR